MLTYPAFGIELADGALKAVKLQRRGTRLVVTWADYRPYARAEDGAVRPRAGMHPRAETALRDFLADSPPRTLDRVNVGFPTVATFNRLIHVPDVGEERLQEIARYEAHRSLRGPIEDYVVRTRVLRRHVEQEDRPCLLYAVQRKLVDAFVTDLAEAGLEFDNLIPSPAALALFVRYDRPAKGDRIVVSIGLRATEVVYLRDRGHAFRTLPLGVVGLGAGEQRASGARRLVDRLAAEIGKGATFFFGRQDFRPASISVFGEGAGIPEVVAEFERHYPTRVEGIGSLHRIAVDSRVPEEMRRRVAQMGSALGLAIAAARAEDPEIELLPQNRARAAARRLPGLAVASLALSAVAWFAADRDVRAAAELATVGVVPTPADVRARRAENLALEQRGEQVLARRDALRAFAVERHARAVVLPAVVREFGPAITDFGDADLRLLECRVERAATGASVSGRVRAPILELRAPTILRQRLARVPGLAVTDVHEVVEERDEAAEITVYAFAGTVTAAGGRSG